MNLTDRMRALAVTRAEIAQRRAGLDELRTAVEATPEWRAYNATEEALRSLQDQEGQLYADCREAILAEYAETGNKKPAQGASIRMRKRYVYDHDETRDWLMRYAPTYLTVDKKRFEKAVPSLAGAPVTIEQEPRATVARDLSEYLR